MRKAQKLCWIFAGIFIVLTIIFVFNSSAKLDGKAAVTMGSEYVINFQGTLFACAFAIASAVSIIGAIITGGLAEAEEERKNDLDKAVNTLQKSIANELSNITIPYHSTKSNILDPIVKKPSNQTKAQNNEEKQIKSVPVEDNISGQTQVSLNEVLEYAIKFQTDDGLTSYLKREYGSLSPEDQSELSELINLPVNRVREAVSQKLKEIS